MERLFDCRGIWRIHHLFKIIGGYYVVLRARCVTNVSRVRRTKGYGLCGGGWTGSSFDKGSGVNMQALSHTSVVLFHGKLAALSAGPKHARH